ncbi:uncharacterized protein LOC143018428 isoform X2 [Oratosquilla oratoria]
MVVEEGITVEERLPSAPSGGKTNMEQGSRSRLRGSWWRPLHTLVLLFTLTVRACAKPLLGPDVMSFGAVSPLILYPPMFAVPARGGLPAPEGSMFEGPDPGLNAAIINIPEVCPSGYKKDISGKCRPAFGYGPNPFHTIVPDNFKGSVQFYMGLQVSKNRTSNPGFPLRRRGPVRGRLRALLQNPDITVPGILFDDDDD